MQHSMSLYDSPFQAVKNKTKTVEMRLYDEKRRTIKAGDIIVFTDIATNEELRTVVVEISVYKDFKELYSHYDKSSLGYGECDIAKPEDMLLYYSQEKIEKYGVVAIAIEVI